MLTFRRALLIAAGVLALIYFFHSGHTSSTPSPFSADDTTVRHSGGTEKLELEETTEQETTTAAAYKPAASWRPSGIPQQAAAAKKKAGSQQTFTEVTKRPLREQLEYQFPYDVESKFPAYIWQTWKFTPASGEFEEDFRPAEASWSELHPGFVHEVITDQVAVHLIRHLYSAVPQVVQAYDALPLPILKADFFRYLILLARGGIYSDIDTIALKSAVRWMPEDVDKSTIGLIIGIEADPDRPDWAQWYSRRIQFCQWTIQAKPGHPVLRDVVATITEETLKAKKAGTLGHQDKSTVEFTGPAVWTDRVFDFFNNPDYFDISSSKTNISWKDFTGITEPKRVGDVVVLPITSFSPGVQQMGAGEPDHPMAFVQHEFKGTWKPENERMQK